MSNYELQSNFAIKEANQDILTCRALKKGKTTIDKIIHDL